MKMQDVDDSNQEEIKNEVKSISKIEAKIESKDENFWEISDLPSRGVFYNNAIIMGRPLRIIDIKKLSSLTEYNGENIIYDVLKRNIKGINIDDLLVGDKMFIVMWLRANSYRNSDYVVDFECPHCKKESSYHFELKNLEVKYLPEDFKDDALSLKLPNGDDIKYRFTTIKDQKTISNFIKTYSKLLGDNLDDSLVEMAITIESINHEKLDDLKKYNYVLGLSPEDLSFYETYISDRDCGIKPFFNVVCKECEEAVPMGVTFRSDFFIPKYKSGNNQ